jgi:tryptophan 2,3-dioxygenase
MSESAVTYGSYLALDQLLSAQCPQSDEHDELLFIVIHQVYELWFKQLLHEAAWLQDRFESGDSTRALHTLRRILTILKTIVAQIDVLETMTPSQFLSFRDRLVAASGFQSAQFRELEAVLGRRDPAMLKPYLLEGLPQTSSGTGLAAARARLEQALSKPSLFDSFLRYLAQHGYPVPEQIVMRDFSQPLEPSPEVRSAILAAYRDDGPPAQVCERMVDVDEGVMEWRYRHVQMVRRTIGDKHGTGGSSGAQYLAGTLLKPAFADLWAVRSDL